MESEEENTSIIEEIEEQETHSVTTAGTGYHCLSGFDLAGADPRPQSK